MSILHNYTIDPLHRQHIEHYRHLLTVELTKFIKAYNKLSLTPFTSDIEYSYIIRVLGNFISKEYSKSTWRNNRILFPINTEYIDLSVFADTIYDKSVENFFESLKKAFYSNLDEEVSQAVESLNQEDRELCLTFYSQVSGLQKGVINSVFADCDLPVESKESIQRYHDSLASFDTFCRKHSNKQQFDVLQRFNEKLKELALSKSHPLVVFNEVQDI